MDDNMALRQMLWLRHGCPLSCLYGDDGEMQCNCTNRHHKSIDFLRDSVDDIRFKLMPTEQQFMEILKEWKKTNG